MQGSLNAPPIVVRTSRRVSSIGVIASAVILYLSLSRPDGSVVYPYAAGLGLLYLSWQLIDPMRLIVGPDGLTWRNTLGSHHWSWGEIGNFRISMGGFVGCDMFDRNAVSGWLRPINKSTSGSHGVLGFGWELGAVKLVELLNTARRQWWGDD